MTNCTCGDCPECRPAGRIYLDTDGLYDAYDILATLRWICEPISEDDIWDPRSLEEE